MPMELLHPPAALSTVTPRKPDPMPIPSTVLPWVRDVGFPAVFAVLVLYQLPQEMDRFRAAVGSDVDRVVKRLESMEASHQKQNEAILQLLMRFAEGKR